MMKWLPPTMLSDRLVLRAVAEGDINAIHAACSDPRLTEYTIFETHTSRGMSEDFVRNVAITNYEQEIPDPFAIALKSDPARLIGCCGGKWTENRCNRSVEFGYWIACGHWGRGYATEAVRLLVPYLFDHYHPERVQAHVMEPNRASRRVLEKAGLTYEGTLRRAYFRRGQHWDIRMYSILSGELSPPASA